MCSLRCLSIERKVARHPTMLSNLRLVRRVRRLPAVEQMRLVWMGDTSRKAVGVNRSAKHSITSTQSYLISLRMNLCGSHCLLALEEAPSMFASLIPFRFTCLLAFQIHDSLRAFLRFRLIHRTVRSFDFVF